MKRKAGGWVVEKDSDAAVSAAAPSAKKQGGKKKKGGKEEGQGAFVDEWTELPIPQAAAKPQKQQRGGKKAFGKGWKRIDVDESLLFGDVGGFCGLEELDADYELVKDEAGGTQIVIAGVADKEVQNAESEEIPTLVPIEGAASQKKKSRREKKKEKEAAAAKEEGTAQPATEPANVAATEAEAGKKKRTREEKNEESVKEKPNKKQKKEPKEIKVAPGPPPVDEAALAQFDLSAWDRFNLHPLLRKGLAALGFGQPSPIQERVLPVALQEKDILGAAETGSGKTLAFGLPMIQWVLQARDDPKLAETMAAKPLFGLVLCPTRELAIQVKEHISAAARFTGIRVVAITGGIAPEKQIRLLSGKPEMVVATPGRFYELAKKHEHLRDLSRVRYLVLDEADRMVERNHYEELFSILAMLPPRAMPKSRSKDKKGKQRDQKKGKQAGPGQKRKRDEEEEMEMDEDEVKVMEDGSGGEEMAEDTIEDEENEEEIDEGGSEDEEIGKEIEEGEGNEDEEEKESEGNEEDEKEEEDENEGADKEVELDQVDAWERATEVKAVYDRQVLVFSATLTLKVDKFVHKKPSKGGEATGSLDVLKSKLSFRDDAEIIDLSTGLGVAAALSEGCISCLTEEKDMYLYYILMRYPGRTIIFVNSIDCIRHIVPLLTLLGLNPLPLHAKMQQRQRLKNLDRFKARSRSVLVATDVAARGLDIQGIEHVIHYQLPRTIELYIHRSGRTARAKSDGISIMLLGPEDMQSYRKICHTLNKEEGLNDFPVDGAYFPAIKKRLTLARKIDEAEHQQRKSRTSDDWFTKTAKDMDIEVDDELLAPKLETLKEKQKAMEIRKLRDQLQALLQEPVMPLGMSTRYITTANVPDLAARLMGNKAGMPLLPEEQTLSAAVAAINPNKKVKTAIGAKRRKMPQKKQDKKKGQGRK